MTSHYNEVASKISNLNISMKEKIIIFFFSLFMALLIVIGPLTILLNLYIYVNFRKLMVIGVWLFLTLLFFLTDFFYLKGITKNKVNDLYYLYISNTCIASFTLLIMVFYIFMMGLI